MERHIDLSRYSCTWWTVGRSIYITTLWRLIGRPICRLLPSETVGDQFFNALRLYILRLFGAKIGKGVVLRNTCEILYPWKLEIGDYVWIGYGSNLYTLVPIRLKSHSCISQNAYLCTGSHDVTDPYMGLIVGEIVIEKGAWVGANSFVHPGINVGREAVVAAGSIVTKDVPPQTIVGGNPARHVKERVLRPLRPGEGGGVKQGSVLIPPTEFTNKAVEWTSGTRRSIRNQRIV